MSEVGGEEKVKNVFKQLLERIKGRRSGTVNRRNTIFQLKTKSQQKCQRNQSSVTYTNKFSLDKKEDYLSIGPRKMINFQKNTSPTKNNNNPIKGSYSNRCKTKSADLDRTVDCKLKQYNQLLITKSYIFEEMNQNKKTSKMRRDAINTVGNFQKKNITIKDFKKEKYNRKRGYTFQGLSTQGLSRESKD